MDLSFSTFAGEMSAESWCCHELQNDTAAMVTQAYATSLTQRGSRMKSNQAERNAQAATSTQNLALCPGSCRGNCRVCCAGSAGLVFASRRSVARAGGSAAPPEST